jgi:thiol:disulfide interchange protein DsbD
MKYLYTIIFLISCALCYGQNNTVSWTFESKKTNSKEYTLIFNASIQEGWYVYSQFLESDDGPVPTELVLQENKNIALEGKANEEGQKIEGFDKLFEMNITKFKKNLKISQKIKTTGPTTIKGYLTFMTCNDEMCLPPSDVPFELQIK